MLYSQQQYDPNNIYGEQQAPQQPSTEASDTWGSWGWGDDDNSNAQPVVSQQPHSSPNQVIGEFIYIVILKKNMYICAYIFIYF